MSEGNGSDDTTPPPSPRDLEELAALARAEGAAAEGKRARHPANRGMVVALTNHVVILDAVCASLAQMRDRYRDRDDAAHPAELVELARIARMEGDSAHQVAAEAESHARRARG